MWKRAHAGRIEALAGPLVVDRSCPLPRSLHRWAYRNYRYFRCVIGQQAQMMVARMLNRVSHAAKPVAPVPMFGLGTPPIWSPSGSPTLTTVSAYTPVRRPERKVGQPLFSLLAVCGSRRAQRGDAPRGDLRSPIRRNIRGVRTAVGRRAATQRSRP